MPNISQYPPCLHIDSLPGSFLNLAVRSLISEDEKEGQNAISVIGVADSSGNLPTESYVYAKDIPNSKICIQPACSHQSFGQFGAVVPPGDDLTGGFYLVSRGANLMVQNTSLDILRLATDQKLTPERFWRLAMTCGRGSHVIDGIDYGSEMHRLDRRCPSAVPEMGEVEVFELEELGDAEKIMEAIVHQGGFWVWMRPDRSATAPCHQQLSISNILL